MSGLDRETRDAVDALVRRLRNPGDAEPLGRDAEPFAEEYLAWLKARGWSPPPPSPVWRRASGSPLPDAGKSGGAEYLAVKAAIAARAAGSGAQAAAGEEGDDP